MDDKIDHVSNNINYAAKVILAFGFIFENMEDGGFTYLHAHEINTLLDWSKLECTKCGLAKLKYNINKSDVNESCSRQKKNSGWRFYKLTNMPGFSFSRGRSYGVQERNLSTNLCLKITQSTTASRKKKIHDNSITTTCAFFVRLLSICMALNDWKQKLQKVS